MDSSPAHSDHRKVFPDMCLCPGLYPCLALCLPVELSIRAWNERTLMLVPVADAQFHHPPTSPPALSAFPSDTVRKEPCRWPQYHKTYVSGVCKTKQIRLLRKYGEYLIIVVTQNVCIIECQISNLYYNWISEFCSVLLMVNWCVLSHVIYLGMRSLACGKQASIHGFSRTVSRLQHSQIQAQPRSYLLHKLRSKCWSWQICPDSRTALLQQLLNRNSPSMPGLGLGKELKDSWAGCVMKSLWLMPLMANNVEAPEKIAHIFKAFLLNRNSNKNLHTLQHPYTHTNNYIIILLPIYVLVHQNTVDLCTDQKS